MSGASWQPLGPTLTGINMGLTTVEISTPGVTWARQPEVQALQQELAQILFLQL